MSPKYEEDLSSALGAICEVLTRENHLLFVGRIQEYDRAGGRLCAELRKGEGTPGGVLYHEPVKVHIYMGQEQGKVIITSDAHDTASLTFGFDEAAEAVKAAGFSSVEVLTVNGFETQEL